MGDDTEEKLADMYLEAKLGARMTKVEDDIEHIKEDLKGIHGSFEKLYNILVALFVGVGVNFVVFLLLHFLRLY